MTPRRFAALLIAIVIMCTVHGHAQRRGGPAPGPAQEITNITGDLYFARTISHSTAFLVTPDGIILADPISTEFAMWLKGELDRRFGKPVKYVIYSHFDFDHAEGGDVFAATAQFIGHENMKKNLDGRLPRQPGGAVDKNGNGRLERDEATGGTLAAFDRLDRNRDGSITPQELYADVRRPDVTYADRKTVTLGGKTVQLIHPGVNHSDDMTVLYFPAERAVFEVDIVFPKTTPGVWADYDWTPLRDWIASIKAIETLDFDVVLPGHGRPGTKADVVANREFLEDVAAAVSKGIADGKSLDELKQTVTLDKYKDWPGFATGRVAHIEAAYNNLRNYK